MPKDEFDFDDPLELNGVAFLTNEDTMQPMAECFVEEFMRLGYNHKQILALFRNPHYVGLNMVWQNKGEPFVRDTIAEVFARWGKPVMWPSSTSRPANQVGARSVLDCGDGVFGVAALARGGQVGGAHRKLGRGHRQCGDFADSVTAVQNLAAVSTAHGKLRRF